MLIQMQEPNDKGVKKTVTQLASLFQLLFSDCGCMLFPTHTLTSLRSVYVCVCTKNFFLVFLLIKKANVAISKKNTWPHLLQLFLFHWIIPPTIRLNI